MESGLGWRSCFRPRGLNLLAMTDIYDEHSVSRWLDPLKVGDERAAQELWERYFGSLVRMAHRRLISTNRRVADEEDVALSTFESLCRGAVEGRFPQLADRQDLWKLLVTITARKASAHRRHGTRQKRGGGKVRGESVFLDPSAPDEQGIHQVVGAAPTPDFAAEVVEECQRLLDGLDEDLRQIAQWKLEGYTSAEIARRLGRSERAVERKLHRIRLKWSGDI